MTHSNAREEKAENQETNRPATGHFRRTIRMCRCHGCQILVFAHRKLKTLNRQSTNLSLQLTGLFSDLLKSGQPGTFPIIESGLIQEKGEIRRHKSSSHQMILRTTQPMKPVILNFMEI
ncbi:hypothetical protein P8936_15735 [Edaphobacter paludis]|uniref:Uncharacterized protein n=1 Tax=Edaphobacter paludis TaxID=3035702 RepID=A0AAU7D612_9BACT